MKYNITDIVDGIESLRSNEGTEKRRQETERIKNEIVFDEKYIKLTKLIEENPEVAELLEEVRKSYLNEKTNEAIRDIKMYIGYSEKQILKARLQLMQKEFHKYTLEELISLMKD